MNCLLVINTMSGNVCKVNCQQILKKHTKSQDNVQVRFIDNNDYVWNADGFEKVIVCGGDGTLFNALNLCNVCDSVKELVYVASGTLNETFHTEHSGQDFFIGKINKRSFSYVCATGSFCEIGYSTSQRSKKKFKALAYLNQVLKYFKVHEISAKIKVNDKSFDKKFTLVMVLHSQRCFGFDFNKLHKKYPEKLFLLTVKSFGKDNFFNKVQLFFTFFRIFFLGLRNKIDNEKIFFDAFDSAEIQFEKGQTMCVDGEQLNNCTYAHFYTEKPSFKLTVEGLASKKRVFGGK